MARKVIYYKDELNDDFSGMDMKASDLPEDFRYVRTGKGFRFLSFLLYRVIAAPVALAVCKLHYGARYVNRKILKKEKGGYFLYINHTMMAGDAFNPHLVTYPRRTDIIVGRQAVSSKALRAVIPMLHGVPIPSGIKQTGEFMQAIKHFIGRGDCIAIYPEAHVWKYYSGIRPFKDVSFRYPAELGVPVYAATVTYKKRKFFKRPRVVVYVDGPFMPDAGLSLRENRKKLRDQVYYTMLERSAESYSYYEYVKVQPEAEQLSDCAETEMPCDNATVA